MLRKLIEKCLGVCLYIFVEAKNLHDDEGYMDTVTIWLNYPKFTKVMQWAGLMWKDKDYRCMLKIGEYADIDNID